MVAVMKRVLANSTLIRSDDTTIFIMKSISTKASVPFEVQGCLFVSLGIFLRIFVKVEGAVDGGSARLDDDAVAPVCLNCRLSLLECS